VLLSFRFANVLSFRDEQDLSLTTTDRDDELARPTGIRERGQKVLAVPAVGIYGANASGKSAALEALDMMRRAVLGSLRWFSEPSFVRRVGFALDPELAGQPSFFEVDMVLSDGVRYTYGFELDDYRVRGEWLHAYPKGFKQVWFNRDESIDFRGEGLRGEKLELERRTRSDALFLTVAAEFNHGQLLPVFEWFRDNFEIIGPERSELLAEDDVRTRAGVLSDPRYRDRIARLLRVADLGITGFDEAALANGRLQLLHRSGLHDVALPYERESLGTRSWFRLLGPLLAALDRGAVVLVDELDGSLHPAIAAEAVRLFQAPSANPRGAQLLFTTHDVTLLHALVGDDRVLSRDTVWLTEKDRNGASTLYPLTGVSPMPRKEDNLLRGYLLGRYGGVPRVSSGMVAREAEELSR
jgi:hypothetical protein